MGLNGYEKAAIFLSSIDEDVASQILKELNPVDISRISACIAKKKTNERNIVETVFKETIEKITRGELAHGGGGQEYLKKLLSKGLGSEEAEQILELVAKESSLESLKKVDPKTLANFLSTEHPQTIALILCLLDPHQAAAVLALLPDTVRGDVTMRVAETERIPENALAEIEEVLKVQLDMHKNEEGKSLEGKKVIADILNHCDRNTEQTILENVESVNSDLAESIKELMLVFEDLAQIDDRGIQHVLKEVSTEDLSLALKTASDTLKDKIFRNMSQRAVKILKEDMESKGPVKVSEVEKAQQNIVRTAKKLDDEGKIIIAGKGKEELIV